MSRMKRRCPRRGVSLAVAGRCRAWVKRVTGRDAANGAILFSEESIEKKVAGRRVSKRQSFSLSNSAVQKEMNAKQRSRAVEFSGCRRSVYRLTEYGLQGASRYVDGGTAWTNGGRIE